jgi:hypothetical protein
VKLSPETLSEFTFIGQVLEWFGDKASIPEGWAIANGENGTDDWYAKFSRGAAEPVDIVIYDDKPRFFYVQRIA